MEPNVARKTDYGGSEKSGGLSFSRSIKSEVIPENTEIGISPDDPIFEAKKTEYNGPTGRQGTIKNKKKKLKDIKQSSSNSMGDGITSKKSVEKVPLRRAFDEVIVTDRSGNENIVSLTFTLIGLESISEKKLFIEIDLENCLDEGGFSQVHSGYIIKAEKEDDIANIISLKELPHEKKVAVKTIPYGSIYNVRTSEIEEIKKEIMFLEELNNYKACVKLLGYAHSEKARVYHLIFEYFETDLQKYLQSLYTEKIEMSVENKIKIIHQIIAICTFLQKNGILHRDLKPKNFLLNYVSAVNAIEIKICDFGVAIKCNDMNSETFTLAGTKYFLAPEYRALIKKKTEEEEIKEENIKQTHVSQEKTITLSDIFEVKYSSSFKSDVFSLGLNILYLFGYDIKGCNEDEVQLKVVIRALEKEFKLPLELISIIKRCLEWDREKRPDFIFLEDYFLYVLNRPDNYKYPYSWSKKKAVYVSQENFNEIQDISDKDQIFQYFVQNGWKSTRISPNFLEIMYLSPQNRQKFPNQFLEILKKTIKDTSQFESELTQDQIKKNTPFIALCKCYIIENGKEGSVYRILNKNIGFDRIEGELANNFLINFFKHIPKSLEYCPKVNIVYRGIPTSQHNHNSAFKLRTEYLPGICFYWTAFVSASKSEETAIDFTRRDVSDEGILFVINLKNKKRMYDLEKFSGFQSEKEVLISPYFYFQIISNEPFFYKHKNLCRITIEEKDDKHLQFTVLRVDSNLSNFDNPGLSKDIKDLNIALMEFKNDNDAFDFIENSKELNIFVITSGSIGKNFLPKLKLFDNVVGYGVFCYNTDIHKVWANKQNLPKLVFLTARHDDIIDFLKLYANY